MTYNPTASSDFDVLAWAQIAKDVYEDGNSARHLGLYYTQQLCDDDNFRARVYANGKKSLAVLSIRGSHNWKDWVISDLAGIGFGLGPSAFKMHSALRFTRLIKSQYKTVILTGHSLGGGYVQLLSALCDLPGVTFNAPGVHHVLDEMSPNLATRMLGALDGPVLNAVTHGAGGLLHKLLAHHAKGSGKTTGGHVVNLRGNMDPVSKVGSHVGMKVQSIHCGDHHPHPHSMEPLIRTLSKGHLHIMH